jgi:pyruvate dehydrogenase E2 component (dihydrolipoamide acetyltransferase)
MAVEIVMPKVDMVMEDGTFIAWLKQEGEMVNKGDPLFVIGTDKADIEVEAPAGGQLAQLGAKANDVVAVSTVIGYIVQPGERVTAPMQSDDPPRTDRQQLPATPERTPFDDNGSRDAREEVHEEQSVRATPLARAQARELGLDLIEVPGSGPRGRIHKADIERYVAAQEAPRVGNVANPGSPLGGKWPAPDATLHARRREPLKGARAIIAERLTLASAIPHIHLTIQVEMSEAARLRQRVNPVLEKTSGLKASYTTIIARAVAYLLPQHPYLNSSQVDDEIIQWEEVNLGIAANQGDHLVVPVIRNAHSMSLEKIVQEMGRLLDLTQQRKLPPAEMKGSTFTISNLGMFGIASFTAIVNPPEAAILAVGQIQETPVARDGEVVVRPLLTLTIAADHRIVDGAAVARFLNDLKMILENPYLLI